MQIEAPEASPLCVLALGGPGDSSRTWQMLLQDLGAALQVEWVSSASMLQERLQEMRWHVVLFEHACPDLALESMTALLRARDLDLGFIVLADEADAHAAAAALTAGAADFIALGEAARLLPVLAREARHVDDRRMRRAAEQELAQLSNLLHTTLHIVPHTPDLAGGAMGLTGDIGTCAVEASPLVVAYGMLAEAVEHASVAICYLDAERRVQFWNRRLLEIYPMLENVLSKGMTAEDLLRKVGPAVITPDVDLDAYVAWRLKRLENPPSESFEYATTSGRAVLVQDHATASGGVVLCTMDVTDHHVKQFELATTEANFRALMDQAGDGVFISGPTSRFLHVNAALCAMTGYSEAELLQKSFADLVRRESLRDQPLGLPQILSGKPMMRVRPWLRNDGSTIQVETSAVLRADGNILGIVRDVTERRRAEHALRASQRLLQTIVDTIPHFLFVKDEQSRYVMANRAFQEVFQISEEQFAGRRIEEFLGPSAEELAIVLVEDREVLDGPCERAEHIGQVHLADGEPRILRTIKAPLRDETGHIYGLVGISEDVTQMECMQAALRENQRLLQSVFDAITHPIFVKDTAERYIVVNRRAAESMGLPIEEVLGKRMQDTRITLDSEWLQVQAMDARVLSGEVPRAEGVFQLPNAEGTPRVVWVIKEPLRDDGGQIVGVVGIAQDITALHDAEASATVAHGRLFDAVHHLWAAFYLYDKDERLMLWNERVYDLIPFLRDNLRLGMKAEEVFRLGAHGVERDGETFEEFVMHRLQDFRNPPVQAIERELKDGRWLLVRDRRTSEGGTVSLAHEITDLKRSEEALRASEARYRLLAENAPDLIFSYRLRPDRGFDYVSPVATEMLGFGPDEHYANPALWLSITHPDDMNQQSAALEGRAGIDGKLVTVRWRGRRGNWIWIEERCAPVFDELGRLLRVEGVARDITARKFLEDQMLQAQRMEAVGRLAGGIAHDFNNMLSVMGSYTMFVQEQLAPSHVAHADLQVIQQAVERSAALTRQLLAFSRRQILKPEILDLNLQVSQVERMLRRLIGEDIALVTELEPNLGPVYADSSQIEQILMNLAVNARDAMPRGGVLALATSNLQVAGETAQCHPDLEPGPYVKLSVRDSGVGMSEDVQKQIFEPFFTTKDVGQGTGLGLSTVYGIVKQMHGDVWVTSAPGSGTTMELVLPQSGQARRGEIASAQQDEAPRGSETILLVEDEEMVRHAAQRILESCGYAVLSAANAIEAEAVCRDMTQLIDLLLTDVVMPDVSGPDLVERLHVTRPDLRVLYMSGYAEHRISGLIGSGGALQMLNKPFSPQQLLHKVRVSLGAESEQAS